MPCSLRVLMEHLDIYALGIEPGTDTLQHSRAIAQSSCVRTTSTRTAELGAAMSWSGVTLAFLFSSRTIPRKRSFIHVAERTSGEFSPTPAVNTRASRPPSEAV